MCLEFIWPRILCLGIVLKILQEEFWSQALITSDGLHSAKVQVDYYCVRHNLWRVSLRHPRIMFLWIRYIFNQFYCRQQLGWIQAVNSCKRRLHELTLPTMSSLSYLLWVKHQKVWAHVRPAESKVGKYNFLESINSFGKFRVRLWSNYNLCLLQSAEHQINKVFKREMLKDREHFIWVWNNGLVNPQLISECKSATTNEVLLDVSFRLVYKFKSVKRARVLNLFDDLVYFLQSRGQVVKQKLPRKLR